ncbi:haloalkane dehalogenase [Paenibacillus hexagrammi]|uniref:Haloalkane dehalogenase n=1 Tax=Paenibacillus hexagrammi TaxID=2908839 RepID=A0ABY3SF44_9BACL|nr:haloalkane dehalogenase [Paenibacillus sp. YPD9-1]UJF32045.1 haloalkane dehalogenase [Paenibacillus sp. YPD9-1]
MSDLEHTNIGIEFPFEARYQEVNGHRLHYIDEGVGPTILMLHGNPTWSYMYRNIIPYLKDFSRCIAVDLLGMGRSDKPDSLYTFLEHVTYIRQFVDALGLKDFILVGHDWGMAIGLHVAMSHPHPIKGIAMLEPQALYPCPSWSEFTPSESKDLFQTLRNPDMGWTFMRENNVFVEGMPHIIINRSFTQAEHDHYREPFQDPDQRKPSWVFPNQLPIDGTPSEVVQAVEQRNQWLYQTTIPKLLFHASPGCTIREPQIQWCLSHMKNLTLCDIGRGFHHLTEENPHKIGQKLRQWVKEITANIE